MTLFAFRCLQIGSLVVCLTGCAAYHEYQPTATQRAQIRTAQAGGTDSPVEREDISKGRSTTHPRVSDADVFLFAETVKNLMRKKSTLSRITRYVSSTVQVLTSGAATGLTAAGGSATLSASLGGVSSIIPSLQDIFQAGVRARAYHEAVGEIELAQTRYLWARVLLNRGSDPVAAEELSLEGIQLLDSTTAAVRVAESVILGKVPEIQDMQIAQGLLTNTVRFAKR